MVADKTSNKKVALSFVTDQKYLMYVSNFSFDTFLLLFTSKPKGPNVSFEYFIRRPGLLAPSPTFHGQRLFIIKSTGLPHTQGNSRNFQVEDLR